QTEVGGRPVHLVTDDEGEQHLRRPPEDQVAERRSEEGAPQPYLRADEREPLADIADRRPVRRLGGRSAYTHERHAGDREGEREGDPHERGPRVTPHDDTPAQRWADPPEGRGSNELVERVRLVQLGIWDEAGDDRVER